MLQWHLTKCAKKIYSKWTQITDVQFEILSWIHQDSLCLTHWSVCEMNVFHERHVNWVQNANLLDTVADHTAVSIDLPILCPVIAMKEVQSQRYLHAESSIAIVCLPRYPDL